ncbi:MAG: co-chaperone GroES [Clostridia bacterium]|nr:co-chaperone GroES [Clostridia bacterium]
MKFQPLFDRVVIKNLEKSNKTKSGIFIPESVGDEPVYGEVLAIGDGDCFDGNKSEMAVSVNDKVLYNKYGATPFKIEGEEFVVLRQSDILGVFKEEN